MLNILYTWIADLSTAFRKDFGFIEKYFTISSWAVIIIKYEFFVVFAYSNSNKERNRTYV
jgi:hypothetical protein